MSNSYKSTLQSNNTELSSNNLDLQALIDQANALPDAGGVELPELTNEGTAADLLSGKELIDGDGNKVTGTFTIDSELNTQDDLIAQIQATVDSLPEAGGGEQVEWSANEDAMVTGTLSSYFNDRATTIGSYAFYNCSKLTTVSFPAATTIGDWAFTNCYSLTTASFPIATIIKIGAFCDCSRLTTASFPVATDINMSTFYGCNSLNTISFPRTTRVGSYAFGYCYSLATASFPAATIIEDKAFSRCHRLKSLYLMGSNLCTLSNSDAFTSTPIGGYSASTGTYGSIYVPASLLTSYQTATNWTYFSSRFVAYGYGGAE